MQIDLVGNETIPWRPILGLPESLLYQPGAMAEAYWKLADQERAQVNDETDRKFRARTGVTRKLDVNDPKENQAMVRTWLRLRDEVMAAR
jgi:hypothetical protein